MAFREVVFDLEPEGAQGVRGKASRVSETKDALRARAPTTGKTFLGTLLGRKEGRVTGA